MCACGRAHTCTVCVCACVRGYVFSYVCEQVRVCACVCGHTPPHTHTHIDLKKIMKNRIVRSIRVLTTMDYTIEARDVHRHSLRQSVLHTTCCAVISPNTSLGNCFPLSACVLFSRRCQARRKLAVTMPRRAAVSLNYAHGIFSGARKRIRPRN